MLIDPHVNPHGVDPDELIDALIEASLDGVVITCTHSASEATPYLKALESEDFIAYAGVELLTPHGALIFIPQEASPAFFKARWHPEGDERESLQLGDEQRAVWSVEAALTRLSSEQGVTFVSHPFSRLSAQSWGDRVYTLPVACALESRTGRGLAVRDFLCDQAAEQRAWARLGSCGGDLTVLGSAATVVLDQADTQAGLCEAIQKAVCWPIELERLDHPRPRYQGVVEDEGPRRVTLAEKERAEAMANVNRHRPQKGSAPIDQLFASGRPQGRSQSHGRGQGRGASRGQDRGQSRGQSRGQDRGQGRGQSRR